MAQRCASAGRFPSPCGGREFEMPLLLLLLLSLDAGFFEF